MKRNRVARSKGGLLLGILALATGLLVFGCGQGASSSTSSSITSQVSSAANRPVEIYRTAGGKHLWGSWIAGGLVVWMESAGPISGAGLGYSGSADWGTTLRYLAVEGGQIQEVPGSELAPPAIPKTGSYELTLPTSWATLLARGPGQAPKLVWSLPPTELGPTFAFHGLRTWTFGGQVGEALPDSRETLNARVSSDALVIPVPGSPTLYAGDQGPSTWQKLLMMTGNMSAPVEVDSSHPKLPASALAGISPYFSVWYGKTSGQDVYDLRTGDKLNLRLPDHGSVIGGHWAAYYTLDAALNGVQTAKVYLVDLDGGSPREVLSFQANQYISPGVSVSNDWLVALVPSSDTGGGVTSTVSAPSPLAGDDLVAFHLPDLRRVDVLGVAGPGEIASVQVSDDTVLLRVSPGSPTPQVPHYEPEWTALRLLTLR